MSYRLFRRTFDKYLKRNNIQATSQKGYIKYEVEEHWGPIIPKYFAKYNYGNLIQVEQRIKHKKAFHALTCLSKEKSGLIFK